MGRPEDINTHVWIEYADHLEQYINELQEEKERLEKEVSGLEDCYERGWRDGNRNPNGTLTRT